MEQALNFRLARDMDKAFLKSLSKSCYHDVIVGFYGDWNDDLFDAHFEKEWVGHKFQIVEKDGEDIGALWINEYSDYIFINEIQIHPDRQNQGIGTILIMHVLKQAAAVNLPVRLNVFKNSRARALYDTLGFKRIGETDTHYILQIAPFMKDAS